MNADFQDRKASPDGPAKPPAATFPMDAPNGCEENVSTHEVTPDRETQARSFMEQIYPDRDIEPLMIDFTIDIDFDEYMEFARRIKQEMFPFKKAKYCISNALEFWCLDLVVFSKELADAAAERWDRKHEIRK